MKEKGKIDKALWYIVAYIILYLIGLRKFPTVFGSLAIAFLFTVIIDVIAELLEKIKIKRKLEWEMGAYTKYEAISNIKIKFK